MECIAYRKKLSRPFNDEAFLGIELLLIPEKNLDSRIENDGAENIHEEFKPGDKFNPGKDHNASQNNNADDAVVQNSTLQCRSDLEIRKEHKEDKEIIDR